VRKVLGNSTYRQRAAALREDFARHHALGDIAEALVALPQQTTHASAEMA
jgi:UDP:flavonoid glycosyltransferase YjiC (YdhE family)